MDACRALTLDDIPRMVEINEQGLPGTGKVSEEEMADLLQLSELALGLDNETGLAGFVLCLLPGTRYGSLNYAWFNQKFQQFLYVDRIAVTAEHRSRKIGSSLYAKVFFEANRLRVPVAAEVSLEPPNPGSMRFHFRHEFQEVGVLRHESKSVTMMMRPHQKI